MTVLWFLYWLNFVLTYCLWSMAGICRIERFIWTYSNVSISHACRDAWWSQCSTNISGASSSCIPCVKKRIIALIQMTVSQNYLNNIYEERCRQNYSHWRYFWYLWWLQFCGLTGRYNLLLAEWFIFNLNNRQHLHKKSTELPQLVFILKYHARISEIILKLP